MIDYSAFVDVSLSDQLYYIYIALGDMSVILNHILECLSMIFACFCLSMGYTFLSKLFSKI